MKDANGNKVKKGDILLEFNRGGKNYGKYQQLVMFWEMPNEFDYIHGINYTITGYSYLFAYVNIKRSLKVDINILPKNFLYYFKHGLNTIYCDEKAITVKDAISNSDLKDNIKKLDKRLNIK